MKTTPYAAPTVVAILAAAAPSLRGTPQFGRLLPTLGAVCFVVSVPEIPAHGEQR